MDLYQIATAFWDQASERISLLNPEPYTPGTPSETPIYDPRPEVPVPNVPEESPPYEKEPETPPMQPEPELPPFEPVIPELEPFPGPGSDPEIPAFR